MFASALASGNHHERDHELGARPTFGLARLREIERTEANELFLEGSFGDAALLNRLPPYRRMRERLRAAGYTFVPVEDLSHAERAAPELRLLRAVRQRSIPYRRMGIAFDEMLAAAPDVRFDDVGIVQVCLRSTTPHEGAHALLFESALASEGHITDRRAVEALIAGEGFAMAFEFWMALLLMDHEARSTPIFFGLNCAQNPFSLEAIERRATGILGHLGDLARAKPFAVMCAFSAAGLIANLRPVVRSAKDGLVQFLADYAGLAEADLDEATTLIQTAFSLDESFRNVTAPTFFRFNGLEHDYRAICELPLEYHFRDGAVFNDHLPIVISQVLTDARG